MGTNAARTLDTCWRDVKRAVACARGSDQFCHRLTHPKDSGALTRIATVSVAHPTSSTNTRSIRWSVVRRTAGITLLMGSLAKRSSTTPRNVSARSMAISTGLEKLNGTLHGPAAFACSSICRLEHYARLCYRGELNGFQE